MKHCYQLLLAACLSLSTAFAADGGLEQRDFKEDALFSPFATLESSVKDRLGHAAPLWFKGYLMMVEARDSGLGEGGIAAFDLRDPFSPRRVMSYFDDNTRGLYEGHNYGLIQHDGRDLVFLNAQKGMQVWDWTEPLKPEFVSAIDLPGLKIGAYADTSWWLAMQFPYVYVAGTNTGIHIVKVDDPKNPVLVDTVPISKLGGFSIGTIYACGNLLVANSFDGPGIVVMDASDPEEPKVVKVLRESVGYSALFNGGYLYGIGERPKVWDLHQPSQTKLISKYEGPKLGSKGGYGVIQDGFLHQGVSNSYAKLDVTDPRRPKFVKGVTLKIPKQDFDGAHVLGNLVLMTCDHGTGSKLVAHQAHPDRKGPEINYTNPANRATNVPLSSRIGLSLTDEIDHESLKSIIVRELGGAEVAGHWSLNNGLANFCPLSPLKASTSYEVLAEVGSVKDQLQNPIEERFLMSFSTGEVLSDFGLEVERLEPSLIGQGVKFRAKCDGKAQLSWDFGDGSPVVKASSDMAVEHEFAEPGRYFVQARAVKGEREATVSVEHRVGLAPAKVAPQHTGTIVSDEERKRIWVVNEDNRSVAMIDSEAKKLIREIRLLGKPRTLAQRGNSVAVTIDEPAQIMMLNARTGEIGIRFLLPEGVRPYGVLFARDGSGLWVTTQATGQLLKIGFDGVTIGSHYDGPGALRGIAQDPEGNLWVTRYRALDGKSAVLKFSPEGELIKEVELANDPGPDDEDSGRGVPNLLSQVVISPDGGSAWIPSSKANLDRGLQRDGLALNFENTVRTIVSKVDLANELEVLGARHDFNDKDSAQAAVFSPRGDLLFVACQGSNSVEVVDAYTGDYVTSILGVGDAPRGLVFLPDGTLVVHGFLSRTVKFYEVSPLLDGSSSAVRELAALATIKEEKMDTLVLQGKKIFYHAADPRMSQDGYMSCASCHQDGEHDGQNWDFTNRGEGIRNTPTLLGAGGKKSIFHHSGNFDEIQDFEHDIRHAFGGTGFLKSSAKGKDFDKVWPALGRSKVAVSAELDALAAYVDSLRKMPTSPYREEGKLTIEAQKGREHFKQLKCYECHGGANFSDQETGRVHNVGTLGKASGKRVGQPLKGIVTPTLHGLWLTAPYLHDGSAKDLHEVLLDRNTKQLHGATQDLSPAECDELVAYLLQIDGNAVPVGDPNPELPAEKVLVAEEWAEAIEKAALTLTPLAPISASFGRPLSLEEAYIVQAAFDQRMSKRLGPVKAYKMAFASEASQKKWGVDAPVSGAFFKKQEVKSGGAVKAEDFIGFHIETEIAFKLKKDIRKPVKSVDELMPYLESVHVGLDVPDLRYDMSAGKLTLGDIVAMGCGAHTWVLGKGASPKGLDYTKIQVNLLKNGEEVYAGKASNVLGDPRESLRQLANQLLERGTHLKKGQFVLTGSVDGAYFPKAKGERIGVYVGTADGLPSVELKVE